MLRQLPQGKPMARRRRRGRHPSDRLGIVIGGSLIAVAVAAVVTLLLLRPEPVERDSETLCPTSGPIARTVFLIDRTDGIGPITRADIEKEIRVLLDATKPDEAVELYVVSAIERKPLAPVIKKCNPGTGADADVLTANPRLMARRWQQQFREPLDKLLSQLLTEQPAEVSPIMESIQSVAVTVLAPRGPEMLPRTLVIVSDLLQNSSAWSLYRQPADIDAFRRGRGARAVAADLRGVNVQLFFIQRRMKRPIPETQLLSFWVSWLERQHGRVRRVVKLSGLNR